MTSKIFQKSHYRKAEPGNGSAFRKYILDIAYVIPLLSKTARQLPFVTVLVPYVPYNPSLAITSLTDRAAP
jgi:hypothetical protein